MSSTAIHRIPLATLVAVAVAATIVALSMADPPPARQRTSARSPRSALATASRAVADLLAGRFAWTTAGPLVHALDTPDRPCVSIKDPTIVRYKDRWHLFCTIRRPKLPTVIEYLSFADWKDADKAPRDVLKSHAASFGAPQVFYFAPQEKWYMICQASDESWEPKYGPAFATTETIDDPASWSPLKLLGHKRVPDGKQGKPGLDFWVICDEAKAHLFFTSLDGHMWREDTTLQAFPHGWSEPILAIQGDVFEASHTYRLAGLDKYLTLIEAQNGHGWRYYKAYLADRLEGPWKPLAADRENAFASMKNLRQPAGRWTDNVSHGELLRVGYDQKLEVDPADLRFLIQGVLDEDRAGKNYGSIPWRLGILTSAPAAADK